MPMRLFRSGWGRASGNVSGNLGTWMVISAVVTVAATTMNYLASGRSGSNWGHLAAVAGMFLGILVMMKAQDGHVPPEVPDEDEMP